MLYEVITSGVIQLHLWPQPLGLCFTTALRIDDDEGRKAGHFVDLFGDSNTFLYVFEFYLAGVFGNDRAGMRVPRCQLGVITSYSIQYTKLYEHRYRWSWRSA